MFTLTWKRLSDGKAVREEEYTTADEAIAQAREPLYMGANEPVEIVVTDEEGAVLFPTRSVDA